MHQGIFIWNQIFCEIWMFLNIIWLFNQLIGWYLIQLELLRMRKCNLIDHFAFSYLYFVLYWFFSIFLLERLEIEQVSCLEIMENIFDLETEELFFHPQHKQLEPYVIIIQKYILLTTYQLHCRTSFLIE